ncbi:hypothetical protein ABKX71_004008 [Aeromonas veronii]|uniref:DUF3223 domain-containing protein n=1 Tax=Aeromonas veronii TaxID=654 RepID=A0AAW5M779_AERVE|nr:MULTISPECIES: hypothetical protein [Aeromonas]MBL0489080.1 hypothetical protein [Aeromonas veronii]MCR3959583.1 hypothetical protein [Aeromonas veronii]MCR4447160.1 hypothetical protein [Aeromonas veronii]
MARIPTRIALKKFYEERSDEVKIYFEHLLPLLEANLPYDIGLAYMFLKTEQAQNRALYGGVVKIHRGKSAFVARVMNFQHLTRDGFKEIYKNVFGQAIRDITVNKLSEAEVVRDKVIHGKQVSDAELREAIADVLEYAELLNDEVSSVASFKPFGNMKGFKGRADSLDNRTTKWLMKGMGFGVRA